jgi:hypothetical protein
MTSNTRLQWNLPSIFLNLLTETGPTPWDSPEFQAVSRNAIYPLSYDEIGSFVERIYYHRLRIITESGNKTRSEYLKLYVTKFRKFSPYSRRQLRFACTELDLFITGRVTYNDYMKMRVASDVEQRVEKWLADHKLHPKDHMMNQRGRMTRVRVLYFSYMYIFINR